MDGGDRPRRYREISFVVALIPSLSEGTRNRPLPFLIRVTDLGGNGKSAALNEVNERGPKRGLRETFRFDDVSQSHR